MVRERGEREDFFWEEILAERNVPFEGLFHLSDVELALLPGLANLGEFLKDANETEGGEEDEKLTFTRAKCFEVCFGLVDDTNPQPELPSAIHGRETLQSKIKKF